MISWEVISLFMSDSEIELLHNEPTGEEMMQERLDEVKDLSVSDTPPMEEEQHLHQTEVKEPLIVCLNVYPVHTRSLA